MLYFDVLQERYGHSVANIVAGSLEELQINGLNITLTTMELAVNYYQDNTVLIDNMDSLTEKRRYITQYIQEAR